jgi:hypothetical protein
LQGSRHMRHGVLELQQSRKLAAEAGDEAERRIV